MERLRPEQLDKYDSKITQIETVQSEYEALKKEVEKVTNTLRIMKILTRPDFAREKLFQIRVKLFDNTYELYDIFSTSIQLSELQKLHSYENYILYYVEIFISQLFHEMLVKQNWILTVSVSNSTSKISKSVNVKNRMSNPINLIIPFENCENSQVDVYLVSTDNESFWPYIKLATVPIDISYKFNIDNQQKNKTSVQNEIININRCYNSTKEYKLKLINYGYRSTWPHEQLIEVIFKNSYHRLDPTKIINKSNSVLTCKISINGILSTIELDTINKSLKFEAAPEDLCNLKKYFAKHMSKYQKSDFELVPSSKELKVMLEEIKTSDLHCMFNVYDKYLRFISYYPL